MLHPFAINADGRQQGQFAGDVHAVDLDCQQIKLRQVRRHPFRHPLRRQRHEPARRRGFGHARPVRRRNIAPRQPNGTPEPAGRDVDQHQIHRPTTQPVLGLCRLPARQRQLVAVAGSHTGPFDRHLAAVETELARRPSPAMPFLAVLTAVTRTAQFGAVAFHHLDQGRDARRQAEPLEARADISPSLFDP